MISLGSLFDGSGTFPLAAKQYGIRPVWASEIEPFPIKVTVKNIPEMKHYGDITEMCGDTIEPVDILCGGSPCQDLSVANMTRQGLFDGEKSSLFFQQIRITREMREHTNGTLPRYAIWENVTGALISNHGRDFRAVLQNFHNITGETNHATIPEPPGQSWFPNGLIVGENSSIAWRVIDSQYWGVPQRRKRIFVVSDFGGQSAGKILFRPIADRDFAAPVYEKRITDPEKAKDSRVWARVNFENDMKPVSIAPTLLTQSGGLEGAGVLVEQKGRLRYLTGKEAGRLQGFPDSWINGLALDNTDPEFWRRVWDTWTCMVGQKRKTDRFIDEWLKAEPTETQLLKMYGNGISLPVAEYLMEGISQVLDPSETIEKGA